MPLRRYGPLILLLATALAPLRADAAPRADLWAVWDRSDETAAQRVDHTTWQNLLDAYLVETDDDRTLFRYADVTEPHRRDLDGYLAALAAIDPRALSRAEQMPYWINLYNALTVRVVLDHPGESSIVDMGDGFFRPGPWNDDLIAIAGENLTLNDIEHRILRPIWNDHRIHFAVNCASIGCPNLAPRAYTRENTPVLLDDGQRSYLNHPRGLHFDERGTLQLSSIFDWYVADFGGTRGALLDYLARQRPDLADRLKRYQGTIGYQYDWSLNSARGG